MGSPFAAPGPPKNPLVGLCRTDERWAQRATRFTECLRPSDEAARHAVIAGPSRSAYAAANRALSDSAYRGDGKPCHDSGNC